MLEAIGIGAIVTVFVLQVVAFIVECVLEAMGRGYYS
jgi:hypothetical protein